VRTAMAVAMAAALAAGAPSASRPGPREKCPVCGMFVAGYTAWIAEAVLRDGTRLHFDGPKDLFRFWLDPGRYLPSRRKADLVAALVTDYYGLAPVDARTASFVVGSDVLGPMGRELVPFARREEAEEFRRDHGGTPILAFDQVTAELLEGLDR
jgi:copper chaperone NosL